MRAAFVVGKPGAGKGTQAAQLEAALGLRVVSMGRLLRKASAHEANHGEPRPAEAMTVGALVPREVSRQALLASLRSQRDDIVIEGVRRATTLQAGLIELAGRATIASTLIHVSDEVVRERLRARRWCEHCQISYGLLSPPPHRDRCKCGRVLESRPDDHDDAIEGRLDVFRREEPNLVRAAEAYGFFKVDGNRPPREVLAHLISGLEQRWRSSNPQSAARSAPDVGR